MTLAPAQSLNVPVANGAHGGGSVPETPLPPTLALLPDLSLWGLQGGGHQEGAEAAEPTLTASNGEPVCAGSGDRSRSQEHGQAADQGLPGLGSIHFFLESFPICIHFLCCCNKSPQASWLKTIETYSLVILEARDPNHCTELKSKCHRLHTLQRSWEALQPPSASGDFWCPWLWLRHFVASVSILSPSEKEVSDCRVLPDNPGPSLYREILFCHVMFPGIRTWKYRREGGIIQPITPSMGAMPC